MIDIVCTFKYDCFTDEALSNTTVWCGHRQVDTATIKQQFATSDMTNMGIQYEREEDGTILSVAPPDLSTMFHLRPPSTKSRLPTPTSPSWLRGASKLLDAGFNQDSWRSLGQLLGYKDAKLDQLENTYQPSRALLKDWLETSGGTDLSTEMLIACLKDLKRFDVIDVIRESEGKEMEQCT